MNDSCTTHTKSGAVAFNPDVREVGMGSSLGLTGLTPWPNWRTLETDSQKGEQHLRNNIQGCPLASTATSSTRAYEYNKHTHTTHTHVYAHMHTHHMLKHHTRTHTPHTHMCMHASVCTQYTLIHDVYAHTCTHTPHMHTYTTCTHTPHVHTHHTHTHTTHHRM